MRIVLFLGFSGSGKTTALTCISRAIVKGHLGKVGSIKRVHETNFSIDSKGKDSWMHATSGSSVVMVFAKKELDVIKRESTRSVSQKEILEVFKRSKVDYLLVEGLHKKFEHARGIKRVICARDRSQAADLIKLHRNKIEFITGKLGNSSNLQSFEGIPILKLPRDVRKAVQLICA
ncbi:MAG: molybdopterin-guanine dinucleotide biosynthesis protein MobB [Nitrososphaerota archaeon]|nr:molybdopterin-guanine dinucleotide biosynthesis protein MobB [Nitrososphaerota archaeon]